MRLYFLLLSSILLAGCTHPAPIASVPAFVTPAVLPDAATPPAPVVWDARKHDDPNDPALIGTIGHPAPVGMLVDMDGTPCSRERESCHPNGDMIDGRQWPYWSSSSSDNTPVLSPAERRQAARDAISAKYDAITQERADVQEQEQHIYATTAQCAEDTPCRINADDALFSLRQHDLGLGTRQAELQQQYGAQVVHYTSPDGTGDGTMP